MDLFTLKILRLQNPKNLNMLKVKTLVFKTVQPEYVHTENARTSKP
jgi:hypothetical protein